MAHSPVAVAAALPKRSNGEILQGELRNGGVMLPGRSNGVCWLARERQEAS